MNIVDLLCLRLGLTGKGKYTKLAEVFGVPRQVVNGWKDRNRIPEDHQPRMHAILQGKVMVDNGLPIQEVPMENLTPETAKQVSHLVQQYLREALEVIDAELGAGAARKNPELVAAYLNACSRLHRPS